MRVCVIAVGRLKAGPERDLAARYFARFSALSKGLGLSGPHLRELDESRARRAADRMAEEGRAIHAELPAGATVLCLDATGESLSSTAFAAEVGQARDAGVAAFCFVIGGPDGLDPAISSGRRLAFGAMTWPHQLVRVMLAEQLYRAVTILMGHPYHRA